MLNNWGISAARVMSPICLFAALLGLAAPAGAVEDRPTIWDLKLGSTIEQMPPVEAFKGYACGSNGGPPLQRLSGWPDYAQCEPEESGLHEIYFEYDDEAEYIARALEDIRLAPNAGTIDKSFPVITSALFDDDGVLKGVRMVTDPRPEKQQDNEWAALRPREEHYLLGAYLAGQFGIKAAEHCTKIPLAEGESPVSGQVVKQDCERTDAEEGLRYVLQQRFLRKEGQADRDPHTGALTSGQYESMARAEIFVSD